MGRPSESGEQPSPVRCLPCCTGCGACIAACPERALSLASDQPNGRGQKRVAVDTTRCSACGLCLPACPRQALVLPVPPRALP